MRSSSSLQSRIVCSALVLVALMALLALAIPSLPTLAQEAEPTGDSAESPDAEAPAEGDAARGQAELVDLNPSFPSDKLFAMGMVRGEFGSASHDNASGEMEKNDFVFSSLEVVDDDDGIPEKLLLTQVRNGGFSKSSGRSPGMGWSSSSSPRDWKRNSLSVLMWSAEHEKWLRNLKDPSSDLLWLNKGAWCAYSFFPRKGVVLDGSFELSGDEIRALMNEVTPNPSDVFGHRSKMTFNAELNEIDADDERTKVECVVSPIEETELGSFIVFTFSGTVSTGYGVQGAGSRAQATFSGEIVYNYGENYVRSMYLSIGWYADNSTSFDGKLDFVRDYAAFMAPHANALQLSEELMGDDD